MSRPVVRRIDQPAPVTGGGNQLLSAQGELLGAPVVTVPNPTDLTITGTGTKFSAVTPTSYANLSWTPGPGTPPRATYQVQQATSADFTANARVDPAGSGTSCSVDGAAGGTYWYRVRAVLDNVPGAWSNVVSTTLPQDTSPPGPVTDEAASFAIDGTLEVRATPPTSKNFRTIQVEIWNAANSVQLDVSQFAGGVWTWSPSRNREQTAAAGGSGATTSVTIRLYAVSWGNVSSTVVTLAAASAAPPTPSGFGHSWSAEASGPTAGTASATLRVTWTPVAGLTGRLSVDGSTAGRTGLATGSYEYPLAVNAAEHSGVADPVLSLSLVFENGLGQVSAVPATATATNAAPPATSVTALGAFSTYSISITRSTAQDLRDYRVRVYRDSVLVQTFMTVELDPVITAGSGNGSYQVDVTAFDVFGQAGAPSALSAPATLEDPAVFAAALRSGARYRDSLGTNPDTLKSALADGNRTSGGIAYS